MILSALATLALAASPDYVFADGFDSACWVQGRTLVSRTTITYGVYPQPKRENATVATWDGLWGFNNAGSALPVPWPGVGGAAPVVYLRRGDFLCSSFTTSPLVAGLNGSFKNPSYVAGPNVTFDIVRQNGTLPMPGCRAVNVPTSDANLVQWKGTPSAPASWCNLLPSTRYYVRQYFTDPAACKAATCPLGTVSYHN